MLIVQIVVFWAVTTCILLGGYQMAEQPGLAVTLWAYIREVLRSSLGCDTGYPDKFIVAFFDSSRQIPGKYIDYAMTASFQALSNSSFDVPSDAV
jgi:hypothetical protein